MRMLLKPGKFPAIYAAFQPTSLTTIDIAAVVQRSVMVAHYPALHAPE